MGDELKENTLEAKINAHNDVGIASSPSVCNKNMFWTSVQQQGIDPEISLSGERKQEEESILRAWNGMLVEAKEYKLVQDTNQPASQLQRNTAYLQGENKEGQLHYRALNPRKLENEVVSGTLSIPIEGDCNPDKLSDQYKAYILKTLCNAGHAYVYEYLGPKFPKFQTRIHEQTRGLYAEEWSAIQLENRLGEALGLNNRCALASLPLSQSVSSTNSNYLQSGPGWPPSVVEGVNLSGCNIGYVHSPKQSKLYFVNKSKKLIIDLALDEATYQGFVKQMRPPEEKTIILNPQQLSQLAKITKHRIFLEYIETILDNRKKQRDGYNSELSFLCIVGPLALVGGGFMTGIGGAKVLDSSADLKVMYAGIGLLALSVVLFAITNYVDNKRIALEPWSPLAPLTDSEIQGGRNYFSSSSQT